MTDETDKFVTGGGLELGRHVVSNQPDNLIGQVLGAYQIIDLIAQGGMSRVYKARRIDGSFEREVAVKVSATGFHSSVRDRFVQEQEVLAALSHPNISRLYDAQVLDNGSPVIVMEYIDGVSVDEYCRTNDLNEHEILRLAIKIIDALAYAHAHLVVHRDIKPSNVLVDSDGQPKLLDFGIAKLLAPDLPTLTFDQPMTPRYATPEQLLGRPISIASDIFQMGLLLHELLVGKPVEERRAEANAVASAAAEQSIRLDAKACACFSKDLVLILERCLQAEPQQRYTDANALRGDITAYLDGFPISAAPQPWHYRLGKLIARNKPATAILLLSLLALGGSSVWYTFEVTAERDVAQRQRNLAEESLNFLVSFFTAANPDNAQGRTLTALELLEEGTRRIDTELVDQPSIQERLYYEVGVTYWRLENYEAARAALEKSQSLAAILHPDDPLVTLRHQNVLANMLREQGQTLAAATTYERIIEAAQRHPGGAQEIVLRAKNNLANSYWNMGRTAETVALLEDVLKEKLVVYGPRERTTLLTVGNLMNYQSGLGNKDRAIELGEHYLPIASDALGDKHPSTLAMTVNLANAYWQRDGAQAALPLLESTLPAVRAVHGEHSYEYWHRRGMIAKFQIDAGDRGKSVDELRLTIQEMVELRGDEDPGVLINKAAYAEVLIEMARLQEAKTILQEVLAAQESTIGLNHPNAFFTQLVLSRARLADGDPGATDDGEALLARMIEELGESHVLSGFMRDVLADFVAL